MKLNVGDGYGDGYDYPEELETIEHEEDIDEGE